MSENNALHGDIVFTVRSTNSESDPEARWGNIGRIGFRADCSECGDFEVGASDEIGELLRGHIRWHHSRAAAPGEVRELAPLDS